MKLLFIGGTQFVGLHMVQAALERGHEVTLFNRGKTNAHLFPQVEKITGDRDGGLAPLKGRRWDAVIDVNGYVPRLVRDSANVLKDAVQEYIFVSTGSVYDFMKMQANSDESSPLAEVVDPNTEEWNGPAYGYLKVLCEQAVEEIYPGRSLILRLGVVAGPHDPTDRVTYWVARVARGGEVLVPTRPDRRLQFIDARDLASFTLTAAERKLTGIYNTLGRPVTWKDFLAACKSASGSDATFTYVDNDAFIGENIDRAAKEFGALPMVIPSALAHLTSMGSARAVREGLTYRPVLETVRDTLAWEQSRPVDEARVAGLDPQVEKEVLAKWKARAK